jgi:hypothetical protein
MSDFAKLQPGIVEGAMQALLEGKRRARELENFVDGIIPLVENDEQLKRLEEVREAAAKAAFVLQALYNRNAKEAFKV